jgi:hypothetical protein
MTDEQSVQAAKNEPLFDASEHLNSETNMNTKRMRCLRCDSIILEAGTALLHKTDVPFEIPSMKKKHELVANKDGFTVESADTFWLLKDMLAFENIGFTNTVDQKKYLICADCEIGPLGLQNLEKKDEFLVCVERVKYC